MAEWYSRTELLYKTEGIEKLKNSKVCIFGVGGVGGYVAEALARCGVGSFLLVDSDVVSVTNINRQIIATTKTVGKKKVLVMKERIQDINPEAVVETRDCFYLPENAGEFDFTEYDYIVDAVDTVAAKIEIAVRASQCGTKVISSMGAGNRIDPTKFEIADIYKTSMDPLAKVMRKELKARGVKHLKVVYSTEQPRKPLVHLTDEQTSKREIIGSAAFTPAAAGLAIASEVVKELTGTV